jgi:hypothetical protein
VSPDIPPEPWQVSSNAARNTLPSTMLQMRRASLRSGGAPLAKQTGGRPLGLQSNWRRRPRNRLRKALGIVWKLLRKPLISLGEDCCHQPPRRNSLRNSTPSHLGKSWRAIPSNSRCNRVFGHYGEPRSIRFRPIRTPCPTQDTGLRIAGMAEHCHFTGKFRFLASLGNPSRRQHHSRSRRGISSSRRLLRTPLRLSLFSQHQHRGRLPRFRPPAPILTARARISHVLEA